MSARWPALEGEISDTLLREAEYLLNVSHEFRVRLKKMMDLREKVVCPIMISCVCAHKMSNII